MAFKMKKGFTLIEMIIIIVVLGILGVFTFTFFGNYINTYNQMRDRRIYHQEGVYIIERISRELRNATNIISTSPLIFQIPGPGTPADTSTTIAYTLSGTQLYRNGNNSGSILIGDSINAFTVTAISSPVSNCYRISVQRGTEAYQTTVCPENIPAVSLGFGGNYADNL